MLLDTTPCGMIAQRWIRSWSLVLSFRSQSETHGNLLVWTEIWIPFPSIFHKTFKLPKSIFSMKIHFSHSSYANWCFWIWDFHQTRVSTTIIWLVKGEIIANFHKRKTIRNGATINLAQRREDIQLCLTLFSPLYPLFLLNPFLSKGQIITWCKIKHL